MKILFGTLLCLFIIGCGKDYKTYSKKEKKEMYDLALEELEKGNSKEMDEINKLMGKLEIAYKNGDKTAEIEYREWREEKINNDGLYKNYKQGSSKVDMTNLAW